MKRLTLTFLTLLLCLASSVVWSETIKFEDLIITNSLNYKKFTNVPFSGDVTGRQQGEIRKGVKIGTWFEYSNRGRVSAEVNYKNGKETTRIKYKYFSNGQVKLKASQKDDKKDGLWEYYSKNGKLWKKETYKVGKKDGLWEFYHENGKLNKKSTLQRR